MNSQKENFTQTEPTAENVPPNVSESVPNNTEENAVDNITEENITDATSFPAHGFWNRQKEKVPKMNILYKTALVLFVAAIGLLIASMVICLVEGDKEHRSFLSMLFSRISIGLSFIGVIFACVSKEKKQTPKTRKHFFSNDFQEEQYYEDSEEDFAEESENISRHTTMEE